VYEDVGNEGLYSVESTSRPAGGFNFSISRTSTMGNQASAEDDASQFRDGYPGLVRTDLMHR
jgi:hypothetical protein